MNKNNKRSIIGFLVVLILGVGSYFLNQLEEKDNFLKVLEKESIKNNVKDSEEEIKKGNTEEINSSDKLMKKDNKKEDNLKQEELSNSSNEVSTYKTTTIKNQSVQEIRNTQASKYQRQSAGSVAIGEEDNITKLEQLKNLVEDEVTEKEKDINKIEEIDNKEVEVTDITITKSDLVDGVINISNKKIKNVYIESSLNEGSVIFNNVQITEGLILDNKAKCKVQVIDSIVNNIKVEKKAILDALNNRYSIANSAGINLYNMYKENLSTIDIQLKNVKDIKGVDINGNANINGNSKILNLNILNGIVLLDTPTDVINIDKNSISANITINNSIKEINNNGNYTSLGINSNVDKLNINGHNSKIYVNKEIIIEKATINGDYSKIMGNGSVSSIEINANNVGIYAEINKDNITIDKSASNTVINRENGYRINTINSRRQGIIEFTLNEKLSEKLELEDICIICHGGNSMTVLGVTTNDNKTYTLNTAYYKDNIYELYVTLPNGNVISKEFNYSYNHPTASNVTLDRKSETEAVLNLYGVDEGGYLYYKLIEKNNIRNIMSLYNNVLNRDDSISINDIKETGNKVAIKTEYNEILISSLEENKEYELYYVMEGYDGRTSPVYGPNRLEKYNKNVETQEYKLDYLAEVSANKFIFTFNKPVEGELKLEDFKIICPTESLLTTKGAKFIVSEDKKTYTIIVQDNYSHKDNKYTVTVNMPNGSIATGEFKSHFNPPVITAESIDRYAENKMKFEFNSDEHGKVYYGIYESNNSVYAGDSTTPMADDVINGKVKSTEVELKSGYNYIDIDLSNYHLTQKSSLYILYLDYDGNYRKGFVNNHKIPEVKDKTNDKKQESKLDITNIVVNKGGTGSCIDLTFNENLATTFGQNNIKLQSLSGVVLPGRIGMSVSFPSEKENLASIELMGVTLEKGNYLIIIETIDSQGKTIKIEKKFDIS